MSGANALVARAVGRRFGDHVVLDGVDLTIPHGQFVALLGRSGAGKTTLLRILAELDHEAEGELHLPERRAIVFQEPRLLPWKRVLANVALGLDGSDARARAAAALDDVDLTSHRRAWPVTLSGGEAQRVALARALTRDPQLLLLDEPFAALDALTRVKMRGLFAQLCAKHRPAVLFITHDVEEALVLADRVIVLEHGRVSTDILVDLAPPRRATSLEFQRVRAALLESLGVVHDAPIDADQVIGPS